MGNKSNSSTDLFDWLQNANASGCLHEDDIRAKYTQAAIDGLAWKIVVAESSVAISPRWLRTKDLYRCRACGEIHEIVEDSSDCPHAAK